MSTFIRVAMMAGALLAGWAMAKDDIIRADQIPALKEEAQQQTVSQRVSARFTRSHYRQFDLNGVFAGKIFDRYLNMLDYTHNVLLASDIAQFTAQKSQLADELKSGKLDLLYAMYNLAEKHRFGRYQFVLSQLAKPMDFKGNGAIKIDQSKAPPGAKPPLSLTRYGMPR